MSVTYGIYCYIFIQIRVYYSMAKLGNRKKNRNLLGIVQVIDNNEHTYKQMYKLLHM